MILIAFEEPRGSHLRASRDEFATRTIPPDPQDHIHTWLIYVPGFLDSWVPWILIDFGSWVPGFPGFPGSWVLGMGVGGVTPPYAPPGPPKTIDTLG